jgi:hypothetical protein
MKRKNNLKILIESDLFENAKKLKEKYPPISENIEGVQKVYPIKKVYQLFNEFKNFYLIVISDPSIEQKLRFFLTKRLASQSSDFLVKLANKTMKEKNMSFQLIQFSLHPNNSRISLLCLSELKSFDELMILKDKLNDIKLSFQEKMDKLIKLSCD